MWALLQPRFAELAELDQEVLGISTDHGNRTGFVLFACAKGEHAVVEDWVLYHLYIGVDKVRHPPSCVCCLFRAKSRLRVLSVECS